MLETIKRLHQELQHTKQKLDRAHRKMINIIARGVVTLISGGKILIVQGKFLDSEVISELQHPQEFGFAAKPLTGAYIAALFNGGNRDHGQAFIIYDPRYTPDDLGDGQACVYDSAGNRVWLKGSDGILIKNGDNTIVMNDDGITVTPAEGKPFTVNGNAIFNGNLSIEGGNMTSTGNVADLTGTMQKMRDEYNAHKHSDPQGGDTGTPDTPMD